MHKELYTCCFMFFQDELHDFTFVKMKIFNRVRIPINGPFEISFFKREVLSDNCGKIRV